MIPPHTWQVAVNFINQTEYMFDVDSSPKSHYENEGVCLIEPDPAGAMSNGVSGGVFVNEPGTDDGIEGVVVYIGPDGQKLVLWFYNPSAQKNEVKVDLKGYTTVVDRDLVENMAENDGIGGTARWSYCDDARAEVKFEASCTIGDGKQCIVTCTVSQVQ